MHEPRSERNNRTIKERIDVGYHRLPYEAIPRVMLRYLAMNSANGLNLFPVKGGISTHYSSNTIMSQKVLDYEKECKFSFGAYVQVNQENKHTNRNHPRTLDAIYLRPEQTARGGHEVMDLNTGKVITRQVVKEVPITTVVIKAVEALARKDDVKSLKITNRAEVTLYDADLDYDLDDDDEEYDSDLEDEEDVSLEADEDIDEGELDEALNEERVVNAGTGNNNNVVVETVDEDEEESEGDEESEAEEDIMNEEVIPPLRRSTRETSNVERLEPTMMGQTYMQFAQLEEKHNLATQTSPNPEKDVVYAINFFNCTTRKINHELLCRDKIKV